MANKTYLALTNEILGELNEVKLTSDNFASASGIQKFAKEALSRAYFDIANENPIPSENAINTKLFPSDTAARGAAPSLPTIILSAKPTIT